jgi:FixJ family two-component response regulator
MATLRLMADGKANKEIATALDISERTGQDASWPSVRKARRDQPHRSD